MCYTLCNFLLHPLRAVLNLRFRMHLATSGQTATGHRQFLADYPENPN